MANFTHFDTDGNAIMVDVGDKKITTRQAIATGSIQMSPECFQKVVEGKMGKGDVLGIARVAGIMGVKNTSSLIPLCHIILIEKAEIEFEYNPDQCRIDVSCTVKTTGVTGVEMEALTGVSITLLTIYDMCKAVDKSMIISSISLKEKTGGKSGVYKREESFK